MFLICVIIKIVFFLFLIENMILVWNYGVCLLPDLKMQILSVYWFGSVNQELALKISIPPKNCTLMALRHWQIESSRQNLDSDTSLCRFRGACSKSRTWISRNENDLRHKLLKTWAYIEINYRKKSQNKPKC